MTPLALMDLPLRKQELKQESGHASTKAELETYENIWMPRKLPVSQPEMVNWHDSPPRKQKPKPSKLARRHARLLPTYSSTGLGLISSIARTRVQRLVGCLKRTFCPSWATWLSLM